MTLTPRLALLMTLPPLLWAGNAVVGRMVTTLVSPMTLNFLRWVLCFVMLLPLAGHAAEAGQGSAKVMGNIGKELTAVRVCLFQLLDLKNDTVSHLFEDHAQPVNLVS